MYALFGEVSSVPQCIRLPVWVSQRTAMYALVGDLATAQFPFNGGLVVAC
jgi:hypothetical protein